MLCYLKMGEEEFVLILTNNTMLFKNGAGMWMNFRRLAITQMFYFFMLFLLSLLVHTIMKTRQSCSISYNNN